MTKTKKKLHLFVWSEFAPDYSSGLAFAIATDETKARKLVIKSYGQDPCYWGDVQKFPSNKPIAFSRSGGG